MELKKLISGLFVLLVLISCGESKSGEQSGYLIRGKVKNNRGNQVMALQELTSSGLIMLDTGFVRNDGTFELSGTLKEKTFCVIRSNAGDLVLVVDTNARIDLEFEIDSIQNYTVKGSKENDELKTLYTINNSFLSAYNQLSLKYAQYNEELPPLAIQNKIRVEYDSIRQQNLKAVKDYVSGLRHSIVPYFATSFLMPEADFAFFDLIDKQCFKEFSQSKYALQLHQKVEELRKTADGSVAPDIVMNDPFGNKISLSSLRGKVVLVDFWASWCKPCRDANPEVVRIYNKYKNSGFDVLGVSLDDNRESWLAAINKDKLLWNHASDLMKWNSPVVKLYSIESIPYTVLVDKEGKIIATRLRGSALEAKLKEIFGY
ncbi:MAG: AhpC/TSA family protein [Bacteroidia bacterium]|nr:AhpC/TSA family protein [Bacteroidia bacterium]